MATITPTPSSTRFYKAAVAQGAMSRADAARCLTALQRAGRPLDPAKVAVELGVLSPRAAAQVRAVLAAGRTPTARGAAARRADRAPALLLVGAALVAGTLTGVALVIGTRGPVREIEELVATPLPEAGPAAVVPAPAPAPARSPRVDLPRTPPAAHDLAAARGAEEPAPPRAELAAPQWPVLLPATPTAPAPTALPDVTQAPAQPSPAADATPAATPDAGPVLVPAGGPAGGPPASAPGSGSAEAGEDLPRADTGLPGTETGQADDDDLPRTDAPSAPDADATGAVAQAVSRLLHVSYVLRDGAIRTSYTFSAQEQAADFLAVGFDKAAINPVNGSHRYATDLELGAGSRSVGRLTHVLPLTGDVTVELTLWLNHSTSRSNLVFMLGDEVGVRWGQQLVTFSRSGSRSGSMKPVSGREPDRTIFRGERQVQVRLTRVGETLTVECDGRPVARKTFEPGQLDGRFGLIASDLRLIVTDLKIQGVIDASRL